jgi:hypothetical protein
MADARPVCSTLEQLSIETDGSSNHRSPPARGLFWQERCREDMISTEPSVCDFANDSPADAGILRVRLEG